jgi:hypothetical protein
MENISLDSAPSPARGRQARQTKAAQKLAKRQVAFKPSCARKAPVRRRASALDYSTVWRVRPRIPGLEFIAIDTWMALGKWYGKACNAVAKKHGSKVRVAYDRDSDTARQTGDALVVTLYGNAASMSPTVAQEMQDTLSNLVFPVHSPFTARIDRATVIKDRGLVEVVVEVTPEVQTEESIRKQYVLPEIMRLFSKNLPGYLKRVHGGHWDLRRILPSPLSSEPNAIYITFKIRKQISEAQMKLEIDNLDTMLNVDCGVSVPVRVRAVVEQESSRGMPVAMPLAMVVSGAAAASPVPMAEVISTSPRPWPVPSAPSLADSDDGFQMAMSSPEPTAPARPSLAEDMARFQNNFMFGI